MELLNLIIDFIESQGIISFVVLLLAFLMYRQQNQAEQESKRHNDTIQEMLKNAKIESGQQGDMLDVLMVQVTSNSKVVSGIGNIETGIDSLLKKADEIASSAKKSRVNSEKVVSDNTESIRDMNDKFDSVSKAVEQALKTITNMLEDGMSLSDEAKSDIVKQITDNLKSTMVSCLEDAIKSTQETKSVEPPKIEIDKQNKSQEKTE